MGNSYPSYDEVQKMRGVFSDASYDHWVNHDFLTWKWWLLLALSIIPWIIWWVISDKENRQEIMFYGCLLGIFAVTLDNIGTELLWWGYPDKLLQMVPPLLPADLTLVPTSLMLVYQLFPKWKAFIVANIIFGAFLAYIAEPVFIWLKYYQLNDWRLTYSWIFYITSTVLARWIVEKQRGKRHQHHNSKDNRSNKGNNNI